ncbi:HD-GYP domain-containing protein [Halobacteriovorax sp. ZH4_bin.1]|uniref:HD-GYP domain-containing protein n=1 Tax=unclassified Halobacteriovorax TaxID=2639665 RepID=UPI00371DFCAE
MKAEDIFRKSHLALNLTPFTIRELFNIPTTPCDVYIFEDGKFKHNLYRGTYVSNDTLKEMIEKGHTIVFATTEQRQELKELQQDCLRQVTRSFSMGDTYQNCKNQLNLITINLRYLFEDPTDDNALNLQYQSLKVLASFLIKNPKMHEALYRYFAAQGHHYIFAQPLLSSIFLVGILKTSQLYNDKDIENFFITSYFKDIGMSAIPIDKYDKENLSEMDKVLLAKHPIISARILQGRIQLSPAHMKVIENHHTFSILDKYDSDNQYLKNLTVTGFETIMVNICDIVAAMISPRPYREALTIFDALEKVRSHIGKDYPHEFKIIINYFRNFFTTSVK